jgi:hypothetical protein
MSGPAGLAEVQRQVPEFDLGLVESEAIRRSLETMESLLKIQAVLEAKKEKAITKLQYELETAE